MYLHYAGHLLKVRTEYLPYLLTYPSNFLKRLQLYEHIFRVFTHVRACVRVYMYVCMHTCVWIFYSFKLTGWLVVSGSESVID